MHPRRLAALATLVAAPALFAQTTSDQQTGVPEGYRPPPGMCRIWIDGVPADRQPAPTDCATAVRRRPANAHVVFGDLSETVVPVQKGTSTNPATPLPPPNAPAPATQVELPPRTNAQPVSPPTSAPNTNPVSQPAQHSPKNVAPRIQTGTPTHSPMPHAPPHPAPASAGKPPAHGTAH